MQNELSLLSAFLTVAEERSFTRAAKQLNISTSGVSHAVRRLEEQIGVRLLTRTTRSVSPTDAGEQLLAHLRPALTDIRGTLTTLSGLQTKPIGRVRLRCPRLAARTVLAPKLGRFARHYREVVLEVTTDDSRVDLVAAGFDAAIHFGEYIAQDMVAFASRRTSSTRSSAHLRLSSHTRGRYPRGSCSITVVSTSAIAAKAPTNGSSRKAMSQSRLRSAARWFWTMRIW
jgi:DNA-binding transcriptional LysR family regulator